MLEVQSEMTLASTQELEDLLDKANGRLSGHRKWLANLPRDPNSSMPSITQPHSNLITAAPLLRPRQNSPPPPECKDISINAFNAGAGSASSVFSASLASASFSLQSLSSALVSAESSAAVALSSATSSMFVAEISMNSAISEAEKSASLMVASAAEMVASASAALNEARVRAASEIQKAEASLISSNQAAQASVIASETAAMNTTKFALSLTFAILGSSILTTILFYVTLRWRAYRKERRQAELKEKIHRRNNTPSPFLQPDRRVNFSDMKRVERFRRQPSQYEISTGIADSTQETFPQFRSNVTEFDAVRPSLEPVIREEVITIPSNKSKEFKSSLSIDTNEPNTNSQKSNGKEENTTRTEPASNPGAIKFMETSFSQKRQDSMKRRNTEGSKPWTSQERSTHEKHQSFSPASTRSNWPSHTRKPTLQYDPERPTDPPIWLDSDESEAPTDEVASSPLSHSRKSSDQSKKVKPKANIGTAI
ncbi:hypothetical protein GcM1_249120 [Golovinomyces cichoracearum]|uniref:Uncharacterized protein n=1 Tax=Golovinomyces cichoracearum TaxID=62708 RepID=A0A420IBY0_9PEZI|nr:hypothetical protein GcM1_249120 [Golovinomyces cichoracearum]